jgi:hypothetical protein
MIRKPLAHPYIFTVRSLLIRGVAELLHNYQEPKKNQRRLKVKSVIVRRR